MQPRGDDTIIDQKKFVECLGKVVYVKEISPLEIDFEITGKILLKGKMKITPGISETIEIIFKSPYGRGTIMECKNDVVVKYEGVMGNEMKRKIEECASLSLVKKVS
ncbi:hypothetical protein IC006_2641 [Sulfuracidifex tepidarius]|uniref:Uncharacterized protein n=1 Tax=Sulfuracidifex tepidarius TaxID=1294262 RepID=A0A510DYJ8_9CREN|nr:hypothetical protein [Sulfuracidifex tepidarius]BBG25306.1 hypothetical protein IC006_2641 [Sulfuracidifex tepidarius]